MSIYQLTEKERQNCQIDSKEYTVITVYFTLIDRKENTEKNYQIEVHAPNKRLYRFTPRKRSARRQSYMTVRTALAYNEQFFQELLKGVAPEYTYMPENVMLDEMQNEKIVVCMGFDRNNRD